MPVKTPENWCDVCGWKFTTENCGRDDCPRPEEATTKHWAVTVSRNGENIVTIETRMLSGRDLSPEDERVIRDAAQTLRGFIGVVTNARANALRDALCSIASWSEASDAVAARAMEAVQRDNELLDKETA